MTKKHVAATADKARTYDRSSKLILADHITAIRQLGKQTVRQHHRDRQAADRMQRHLSALVVASIAGSITISAGASGMRVISCYCLRAWPSPSRKTFPS